MTSIITLTINPAVDVATSVDRVEPTRKLYCGGIRYSAGGGGINVARTVRCLGGDVAAVYPVGGSMGRFLHSLLDAEGVESVIVPVTGETREDIAVFETSTRKQYRFVLEGAPMGEALWQRCIDAVTRHAGRSAFLVASGSLPPRVPHNFYARIATLARGSGSRMVLDTSGAALKASLEEGVYLVKPNLRELRLLTGAALADQASRVGACRKLVADGKAEVVALTMGEEGALLVTAERVLSAAPLAIDVAGTVGAGDSFVGGMVWALAEGRTLDDAFRYGVAAASATLLANHAVSCSAADVERLTRQIEIEEIGARG